LTVDCKDEPLDFSGIISKILGMMARAISLFWRRYGFFGSIILWLCTDVHVRGIRQLAGSL
jgi:hypothetical protein